MDEGNPRAMIPLPFAAGKSFLVVGYGRSGVSSAAALKASKARRVLIWDDSSEGRTRAQNDGFDLADTALFETVPFDFDAVVIGPGVPIFYPSPHPFVTMARAHGIEVQTDIGLLFKAQPEATYVGVTGTNGKSTTTALIAHILENAGVRAQCGGNIGTPALTLEPMGAEGTYVLELSSYQLERLDEHPLKVGVLLNITPDHIDHHGSMGAYVTAKARIAQPSANQTLVIGVNEHQTQTLLRSLKTSKNLNLWAVTQKGQEGLLPETQGVKTISYTDQNLFVDRDPHPVVFSGAKALPGVHNAQNAAAAYAACLALDTPREAIEAGLQSFSGLAHRQQLITTLSGVRFINDSKATNADAAAKALVCYPTIYWIVGGRPKDGGLEGLEASIATVRHAFLIGESQDDFALWCKGKLPFTACGDLEKAVKRASAMAWEENIRGSCVLLSPACASFDQYPNFEARGEHFADLVTNLSPPCRKGG